MNLWRQTITEKLFDAARVAIWGALAIDLFLMCVFSVWFLADGLWHLRGWCSRVLFGSDW
jgi:hypothetical protein